LLLFTIELARNEKEAWRTQVKHLTDELGDYSIAAITLRLSAQYRDDRLKVVQGSTVKKEINMLSKVLTVKQCMSSESFYHSETSR